MDFQRHLEQAIRCNDLGELAEAEALCHRMLEARPDDQTATHLLAVVVCRRGRLDEGEVLLRRLTACRPRDPDVLRHLVDCLHEQGRWQDAIEAGRALAALVPNDASARMAVGLSLDAVGDLDAALDFYAQALMLRPDFPKGYFNLGHALYRAGRANEAVAAYSRAVDQDPTNAEAFLNLGNALLDLERFDDALLAYDHALQISPDLPEALSNAGVAALNIGRLDVAVALQRKALDLDPGFCAGWTNLGGALQRLGQVDQALAAFERAASLEPSDPLILANLAQALDSCGQWETGGDTHRRAVAVGPDCATAHFNLSIHLLRRGEYAEGWREYSWRWRGGVKALKPRGFAQPEWAGEDLSGRTLLLHAEQGFGDTIQFARFVSAAAARGGRVVLEVQPSLVRLLDGIAGADRVVACGDALPPFDVHLPLMSLPGVLETPERAFAADIPYIAPPPTNQRPWTEIADGAGPRVGLVWSGNPAHQGDRQRSIPAADMLGAVAGAPVRLFSLQKKVREADGPAMAFYAGRMTDLAPHLDDFTHTASALAQMDLVICVDTAVAHLAGAMGRPVWLLLPAKPDWRWQLGRDDSPWYPSMRLFRQTRPGDWAGVLERVAADLARFG